jgi:hypothetical protein
MPATPALSAAPPNALLIWTDGLSLFTELPGPDSRPVVIRYPLTYTGLSLALGLVRTRAYDTVDRSVAPLDIPRAGTIAQQINARDLLRKMRLIP